MKTLQYLDIHTHIRLTHAESVSVGCLSLEELTSELTPKDYTSAGVHPWWLEDCGEVEISNLKGHVLKLLEANKLWALGEAGIDRSIDADIETQKSLFLWHLQMAEKFHLPLVIHNVRSGADFLELLKEYKPTTPWIFHDFRGNEVLLKDLLRLHKSSYFSFGLSIDNSPQVRELLPSVPLEHLFLETDSQKHLDIHDIYLRAAHQLDIDVEFLKAQIWHNFKKISQKNILS